jgi:hypothetical protein
MIMFKSLITIIHMQIYEFINNDTNKGYKKIMKIIKKQ